MLVAHPSLTSQTTLEVEVHTQCLIEYFNIKLGNTNKQSWIVGHQDEPNVLTPIIDAKERKRQRDRERYAAMSEKKRDEKNKKRREARQRNKGRPMMPGSSTGDDC